MSYAFCLNITSCERVISVISVVFFLPIEPHEIDTMGTSLINPQFLASKCLNLFKAIDFLQRLKISHTIVAMLHHGKCQNMTCKSINSLHTCV